MHCQLWASKTGKPLLDTKVLLWSYKTPFQASTTENLFSLIPSSLSLISPRGCIHGMVHLLPHRWHEEAVHSSEIVTHHWHWTPQERLCSVTCQAWRSAFCRHFSLRQRVGLHAFLTKMKGWRDVRRCPPPMSIQKCWSEVQLEGTGRSSCLRTLKEQRLIPPATSRQRLFNTHIWVYFLLH